VAQHSVMSNVYALNVF